MSSFPIFVFILLFDSAYSWVGVELHSGDFDGYCESKSHDLGKMAVNETKRLPKVCAIATCKENGDINYTGCSPVQVLPPCYLKEGDLSKPFPECCYEIVCDTFSDNSIENK